MRWARAPHCLRWPVPCAYLPFALDAKNVPLAGAVRRSEPLPDGRGDRLLLRGNGRNGKDTVAPREVVLDVVPQLL